MALIQLKDITKAFKKQQHTVHALRNITLEVNSGELVAIWGPSGSGKSTLLNILGALDFPDNGDYHFNGVSVRKYSDLEVLPFSCLKHRFHFSVLQPVTSLTGVGERCASGKVYRKAFK